MNLPEARGEKIPGSRFFRDFCGSCKEPIRVPEALLKKRSSFCDGCVGPAPPIGGNPAHPQIYQHDEDREKTWNN